ncbi:MAG: BamA/TamA family outer membrane protein [Pirellulaceae bacterium]|nr:BamA/TamA family outer membrane protein [Pirellulaceae bacterium]
MIFKTKNQNAPAHFPHSFIAPFQNSDEADRMKDTNSTANCPWAKCLAMLGCLVCLTGCVSPLTSQPWVKPAHPTPTEASSNQAFTISPVTGETLSPPADPGEINFNLSDINPGTSTALPAPAGVNHSYEQTPTYHAKGTAAAGFIGDLAPTPDLNAATSQRSTPAPYVARQFPSDPPPNYSPPTVAPPSLATAPPTTGNAPPPNYQPTPTLPGPLTPSASPGLGSGLPPATSTPLGPPIYGTADGAPMLGNTGIAEPYAPITPNMAYQPGPTVREADLIINGFPARTGRIMLGGAVNSDAGITGQLTIDERNFDICRWPRSFQDLFSGTAFRGAGQTFRLEAAPGTNFKRYTMQFADPNLFGYKPVSMSVSGFLYDRRFNDWDEERLGGRLSFGYRITPDLSISAGITGQRVDMSGYDPDNTVPALERVYGKTSLFSGELALVHDTRDSPIQASRGHFFEANFEQAFGDFSYPRFELEFRRYWLVAERADGSGKQTFSFSTRAGYSGKDTPIYENFFAGGYATIRGFEFRGASPVENLPGQGNIEVGGRFQWLNTVEYIFPITADDAFRGVGFVDFGTVEPTSILSSKSYRVAPGLGLRVALPMLGPAPLAFDFAYPVAKADTDRVQVFSFYMSMVR